MDSFDEFDREIVDAIRKTRRNATIAMVSVGVVILGLIAAIGWTVYNVLTHFGWL